MLFLLDFPPDLLCGPLEFMGLRDLARLLATHPGFRSLLTDSPSGEPSLLSKAAGRPENAELLFWSFCKAPQDPVTTAPFWVECLLESPCGLWVHYLDVRAGDCADREGVLSREDAEPSDDSGVSALAAACSHGRAPLVRWALGADSAFPEEDERDICKRVAECFLLACSNRRPEIFRLLRGFVLGHQAESFSSTVCEFAVRLAVANSPKCPSTLKDVLGDPDIFAAAGGLEFVWELLLRAADPAAFMWFLGYWDVPGEVAIGDGFGFRRLLERGHYEVASLLCDQYSPQVRAILWTPDDGYLLDRPDFMNLAPDVVLSGLYSVL